MKDIQNIYSLRLRGESYSSKDSQSKIFSLKDCKRKCRFIMTVMWITFCRRFSLLITTCKCLSFYFILTFRVQVPYIVDASVKRTDHK